MHFKANFFFTIITPPATPPHPTHPPPHLPLRRPSTLWTICFLNIHWTTFCQTPFTTLWPTIPITSFKPYKVLSRGREGGGDHFAQKKHVCFRICFKWYKAFLDYVFFSLRGVGGRVRTHNGKFHNVFFLNHPYTLDPIWYQYRYGYGSSAGYRYQGIGGTLVFGV